MNQYSGTVSVIDTATNKVTKAVKVGVDPSAFGQFIVSLPAPGPVLPVANFSSNVTTGYLWLKSNGRIRSVFVTRSVSSVVTETDLSPITRISTRAF